jgi:exopolysaccharide biosynthesis polyprenyl glycosylphosphotransferase
MNKQKAIQRKYIVIDIVSAAISWFLFYLYRKVFVEPDAFGYPVPLQLGHKLIYGILVYSFFLLLINFSSGYYKKLLRKSRLEDVAYTFFNSFIGISIIFFAFILDDVIASYKNYYQSFLVLFILQFSFNIIGRMVMAGHIKSLIRKGKISFKTIIIGRISKIDKLLNELKERYPYHGHSFVGYVPIPGEEGEENYGLKKLGNFIELHSVLLKTDIEDVIILLNSQDSVIYDKIINALNSSNIQIFVNTEMYHTVKDKVEITSLFRSPLLSISRELLTPWQASIKQVFDIVVSLLGIILALPFIVLLSISIKLTSKGPIIYSHERIGQFGKSFKIYKFRSMYKNAEINGPQLASKNDTRITPVGKFMRRLRLDEIPNLINVLKGEMSLVGPRPERKYYIEQIIQTAPEYTKLLQVKPGVTSWGQVKYGYAENVEEMIRRMNYDLLYINNISLYIDFLIIAQTIIILFKRKGI